MCSCLDVVHGVGRAWDGVGRDVITKVLLKCGMSNALNDSEDDQTLEWFPQEIGVALPHDGDAAVAAANESTSDASVTGDEESPASESDEAM